MATYTIVGESVEQSKKDSLEFIKRLPEGFQPPQKSFLKLKYALLKTMEESSSLLGENPYGIRSSIKRRYCEVSYYDRNFGDPWQNKRQKQSKVDNTPAIRLRNPTKVNKELKQRTYVQYRGDLCRSERQMVKLCGNVQSAGERYERERENQVKSEAKCKNKLARWFSTLLLYASRRQSKERENHPKDYNKVHEEKRKGCWSWFSLHLLSGNQRSRNAKSNLQETRAKQSLARLSESVEHLSSD